MLCSNISHRDLKLENLLLQRPASEHEVPAVKIADFGLAKKMAESQMRTICGTPQYVAPEVILVSASAGTPARNGREEGALMLGAVCTISTEEALPNSRLQATKAGLGKRLHAQSLHLQGSVRLLQCEVCCAGDARVDVWPSRGPVERRRGALHPPWGLPALL